MIEAQGLSKYYGELQPFRTSRSRFTRAVVAFLGPNGAGKSTTMKLLTGYLAPWQGWRGSPATAYRPIGWQVPPGWVICRNGPLYTDTHQPAQLFADAADWPPPGSVSGSTR